MFLAFSLLLSPPLHPQQSIEDETYPPPKMFSRRDIPPASAIPDCPYCEVDGWVSTKTGRSFYWDMRSQRTWMHSNANDEGGFHRGDHRWKTWSSHERDKKRKAADHLVMQLANADPTIVREAQKELRKFAPLYPEKLGEVLSGPNPILRLRALDLIVNTPPGLSRSWLSKWGGIYSHKYPTHEPRVIQLAVEALADDSISYNNMWAWHLLYDEVEQYNHTAVRLLEEALWSPDDQKRWDAFDLLSFITTPSRYERLSTNTIHPSDKFLEVAYERGAIDDLLWHWERCSPNITSKLYSEDEPWRKLLCAEIVARKRQLQHKDRAISILLKNLEDDDRGGNCLRAGRALYAMGPEILPEIRRALWRAKDAQQKAMLQLIEWDLTDPPENLFELRQRHKAFPGTPMTNLFYDPVLQEKPYDFTCLPDDQLSPEWWRNNPWRDL